MVVYRTSTVQVVTKVLYVLRIAVPYCTLPRYLRYLPHMFADSARKLPDF